MRQFIRTLIALLVAAPLSLSSAIAQPSATGSILGTVFIDTTDARIANADIVFTKLNLSTRSDSAGNFQISGIPAGQHEFVVRRVGYEPYAATLTFRNAQKIEADFMLKPIVTKLDRVDVKAPVNPRYAIRLADFEERRKFGMGRFLTSDIFEKAIGRNMSEVLVGAIPGVRTSGKSTKQVLVSRRTGTDCAVQVVLNGISIYNGSQDNFDINSLNTAEVIGLEYYTLANTPLQFNSTELPPPVPAGRGGTAFDRTRVAGGSTCGAVVIWTK